MGFLDKIFGESFPLVVTDYYQNGQKQEEGTYKNGKKMDYGLSDIRMGNLNPEVKGNQ